MDSILINKDKSIALSYIRAISAMMIVLCHVFQGCLTVNQFYIKIYCFLQKSVNFYLHFLYVYCSIDNFVLLLKYGGEL